MFTQLSPDDRNKFLTKGHMYLTQSEGISNKKIKNTSAPQNIPNILNTRSEHKSYIGIKNKCLDKHLINEQNEEDKEDEILLSGPSLLFRKK
jgi:hypothetical protein